MKKYKSLVLFLILTILSGCSSKAIRIKETMSTVTSDKSKAYIVFAYDPPKALGPAPEVLLYEFDPKTDKQKLLMDFDVHGKFIQKVASGKHYYIIRRAMSTLALREDIKYQCTINAKQGKITYVDLYRVKIFTPQRELLEKKLQEMPCTLDNLHRYGFEKIEEEEDSSSIEGLGVSSEIDKNSIKRYRSPLLENIKISCQNEQVMNFCSSDPFCKTSTLKRINKLPIVKPAKSLDNYKLLEIDDIKSKYNIYHILHKDALQHYRFEIYDYSEKSNEHKYGNIQTVVNFPENIDLEDMSSITQIINNKYNSYSSSDSTGKLMILFNVENYVSGNRAKRYFALSEDNALESMVSFQVSAEFVDLTTGQKIGKIKITRILGIGIFGGSALGVVEDAIDDIFAYTIAVYVKKTSKN